MIGLQALSEFAELIYTPDIDFTVQLSSSVDPNFKKTVTVNQQNSMVLQLVEVITNLTQFDEYFFFYPFAPTVQTLNHPLLYKTRSVWPFKWKLLSCTFMW